MSDHPKSDDPNSKVVHVYDGIEEEDNQMPNWWLGILYASIVFAYGYWMYFHVADQGETQVAAMQAELAVREQQAAASRPVISDELLAKLAQDPKATSAGAESFKSTCAACHGAEGQGLIGPNLTDGFWLHGNKPVEIHKSIALGVIEKGMPGWESSLGAERVQAIAAYVLTLKGKNVPGKPPQGEKLE